MRRIAALLFLASSLAACSYVAPGEEGVMVNSLGSDRGVTGPLTNGYYYTGFFSTVYPFPTFTQNYNWDASNKEQIAFSDSGGLSITTDIGISYHVEPGKVVPLFLKYRRGIDEITNIYLHNMVRDALIEEGSKHPIEYIYGEGRPQIIVAVQEAVQAQVLSIGIVVEKIYWIGKLGLPDGVTDSINAKIAATQIAQQKENELQASKADAAKLVAAAQGEAESTLVKAKAQAEANDVLAKSLTPQFVEYQKTLKWDGKLPLYSGGNGGLLLTPPSVGR